MPDKPTFAECLWTWFMLPVYAWQGSRLRARTHRMPPPQNRDKYDFKGKGEPLKVLVVGDSSAAGVGVERIEQSFAWLFPHYLSKRSGRAVRLRIAGMNSATSGQIRDFVVPHIRPRDFDYIALNIGTNDAKNFHRGNRFCANFGGLLYALRARFPGATIIWSGVLDLEQVPALPSPLNLILGIRSRLIGHNGRVLCSERGALAPEPEWRIVEENFSSDGFHASAKGYDEWASNLADYVIELEQQRSKLPA